ncbi:helix-turn-helix domain-containing protein [Lactococcus lactis]|uniref:helix-turn-helix domain-containing protein n=1 Tax=Lactococcus lactis TaxID=1358 RepID=UPI003D0BF8A5
MTKTDIKFPQMVDYFRKEKGWTMKELANKMGKTESAISRWISGDNSPKMEDVHALAKIFDTDIDTLVYGAEVRNAKAHGIYEPIDLAEVANSDDDAVWSRLLSSGGRPLTEKDKMAIKLLFSDKWDDITQKAKDLDNKD